MAWLYRYRMYGNARTYPARFPLILDIFYCNYTVIQVLLTSPFHTSAQQKTKEKSSMYGGSAITNTRSPLFMWLEYEYPCAPRVESVWRTWCSMLALLCSEFVADGYKIGYEDSRTGDGTGQRQYELASKTSGLFQVECRDGSLNTSQVVLRWCCRYCICDTAFSPASHSSVPQFRHVL